MRLSILLIFLFTACQTLPPSPGTETAATPTQAVSPASIDAIVKGSACSKKNWTGRGTAPLGYYLALASNYAKHACSPGRAGVPLSSEAESVRDRTDAISWYASNFRNAGLGGSPNLRKVYTLLIGLGMRESSGGFCEGIDMSASPLNNHGYDTEAGVFQTSWNARAGSPDLVSLFQAYKGKRGGYTCPSKNYGTGDDQEFQRISKEIPDFAIEFTAIGLRTIRKHWGPINTKAAEIYPPCDAMLAQVEKAAGCGK